MKTPCSIAPAVMTTHTSFVVDTGRLAVPQPRRYIRRSWLTAARRLEIDRDKPMVSVTDAPIGSEFQGTIMRLRSTPAAASTRSSLASSSLLLLLLLGSCAVPPREPSLAATPEQIPALQAALAKNPNDVAIRIHLAEAHRRAGQPNVAATLLEPVAASTPIAAFYLGLVREDQGRAADARQLYEGYVARAASGELRDRVRDRLSVLGRLELQQAVRSALARERELASRQPEARIVGVFPFLTTMSDPQLHPLGTAFAEILTSDLAQTERLHVVERARVQQLLDEIKLAEARRVDPATAVRSGRLLGAGTIVQGRIEGAPNALAFQAAVVRVQTNASAGNPLRERDALARLFDVEKKLALGIYDRMGIQLTAAERDRVTHQATRNVQALLELGFGLEAQDAGHFSEAAAHFTRAAELDPGFALARQRATEAAIQVRADAFSTASLGQLALADVGGMGATGGGVTRRVDLFAPIERLVPDPSVRDPSAEALGGEGFGRHATAEIVIKRPTP
jgi:TolB-like protein